MPPPPIPPPPLRWPRGVTPALQPKLAVVQRKPFTFVKSDGSTATWNPTVSGNYTQIESYIKQAYGRSDRRELKRLKARIEETQEEDLDAGNVHLLLALLKQYIGRLKTEKGQLKLQIQELPKDSNNKANRANVAAFANGTLIYKGPQGLDRPHFFYRSGFGPSPESTNKRPEGLADDFSSLVSDKDSEIRLLDDLEKFLVENQEEHGSKGYKDLVIQIYSTNGSCDPCKHRISKMADRLVASCWQTVVVKIVYETRSLNAPRNDRDSGQVTFTSYGRAEDPQLTWKDQSKYRLTGSQQRVRPYIGCEEHTAVYRIAATSLLLTLPNFQGIDLEQGTRVRMLPRKGPVSLWVEVEVLEGTHTGTKGTLMSSSLQR